MFEVVKVFFPVSNGRLFHFALIFGKNKLVESLIIFRVVAIVFIAASEVRVYDDRWHAFPDLRSCPMYMDLMEQAK